jgi:peptidoglycan hydrolase-like protein with peptidoglycan-binding domain
MIFAILRKGDGISKERVFLTSVVKNLQTGLRAAAYAVSPDGQFGTNTENAVKTFQEAEHVETNGIVSKATWTQLSPYLQPTVGASQDRIRQYLPSFEGDLNWVHEREGHRGTLYWPGGSSGVTLDPGVDLGQVTNETIEALYGTLLTAKQQAAIRNVIGIKGAAAKNALDNNPTLRTIRIGREDAERIMPQAGQSYWNNIVDRFRSLADANTLPSVQTVLLSLSYNRGGQNQDLEQLRGPLSAQDWGDVASRIGGMQQNHELEGIRIRRRMEADLIRAEVQYLQS